MKDILKIFIHVLLLISTGCLICSCSSTSDLNHIDDQVGLLTSHQIERLEQFHRILLTEQDVQFFVTILDQAAPDLDQTALDIFAQRQLGLETSSSRGLLLIIDPNLKQARIEVGYDLEETFPDGLIASLEYDQMLPFFRQNRIGQGIEALTELLTQRLAQHKNQKIYSPKINKHLSGGAGARISTASDDPTDQPVDVHSSSGFSPQPTPRGTLLRYRDSLAMRIKSPDLLIFTPESRDFFRNWLVTDAQQNNALRLLNETLSSAETINLGDHAVIRFPIKNRQASPFFLRKHPSGWQLDFATMSQTIIFNHRNQWHFKSNKHPYIKAFSDWRFDSNGFPHIR